MDSGMGYIEAPHFPKYVWQNNGQQSKWYGIPLAYRHFHRAPLL